MTDWFFEIALVVLFLYVAFTCFTGKNCGVPKFAEKYTKESLAKTSVLFGIACMISALCEIFNLLRKFGIISIAAEAEATGSPLVLIFDLAGLVPVIIAAVVGFAFMLKKKDK